MAKTKSNNRRTKTSTRRRRGGIFGYDVRGSLAKAVGKSEDAFKPDDMGIMAKANAMGAKAKQMMRPGQHSATVAPAGPHDAPAGPTAGPHDAPAGRGGRRRRGSRKTKRSMKSKKSKKSKK